VVTSPAGNLGRVIHLEKGDVVAGRWSRCKHYNEPVPANAEAGGRRSFVAYFETRLANPAYENHIMFDLNESDSESDSESESESDSE